MKNKIFPTLLLTLIIGIKQSIAQFYNQGSEVTIQAGATVTIEGDFYNKSTSNFKNYGRIEIKDYVTNDQSMTEDFGGYWILNGNSTVKIGGSETIWMYALNINNPGGFLLQNSLRIGKQMEFANGIMSAENPGNVVTFTKNAQPAAPIPTDASHINGEVIKEGENQTFKYPIGNATNYQPIEVAFADNGNELGLLGKYYDVDAGSAPFGGNGTEATLLNNYNGKEYWDLVPVNRGNTKATVKVFWDGYRDSFGDAVSMRRVAHLASATGKWENEGTNAGIGTTSVGSVLSNIISDWSPFTLGTVAAVALPITLINFSGKKVGTTNVLIWTTSQEKNASHFEIERSADAQAFEKIGKVFSTVVSKENTKYEFVDLTTNTKHLTSNIQHLFYYRLKLVDLDGKYAYSKIINITNSIENQIVGQFYPNPSAENFATIDIVSEDKSEWKLSTIDVLGKLIKLEKVWLEKGINKIQITGLRKGLNLVQFENHSLVEVRKIIKN